MAEQYKIKWSDNDTKTLKKEINAFNKKIDRISKYNPLISDFLPNKLIYKEEKKKIYSRNDFKRVIKSINKFQDYGSEKLVYGENIVPRTKYEVDLAIDMAKRISKKREKMNDNFKPHHASMRISLRTKNPRLNADDINFEKNMKSMWNELMGNYMMKNSERYKTNYITSITKNFDEQNASKLIKLIKKINAKDLIAKVTSNPILELQMNYEYAKDGIEEQDHFEYLFENFNSLTNTKKG